MSTPARTPGHIYQILDALDYGDAVANIVCRNAQLLSEIDESAVLSLYAHERMEHLRKPIAAVALHPEDAVIWHYSCFSELEGLLRAFRGRRAAYFHNITPARYFSRGTHDFRITTEGFEQLSRIADDFDIVVGDSEFNLVEYAPYLRTPRPTFHIYPPIEREAILARPVATPLLGRLRAEGLVTFLFVGRLARNKRQDQVMRVFDHYWRTINRRSRLFLVGGYEHSPDYHAEIETLRARLPSGNHVVLTGKVPDEDLQAYYRAADVFLCASEHEGFCVPLVEAMAHGIPVLALAAAAVPETMGRAGVIVRKWDVPRLAELIHLILGRESLRERLRHGQYINLSRFSHREAQARLRALVRFLRHGEVSPIMVWRGPGARGQVAEGSRQ